MIFPGHLSAGFLVTYGVLGVAGIAGGGGVLSPTETTTLLVIGTLLGDAPDIDILFYFFSKKTLGPSKLSGHRKYLTHAPLLWLITGLGFFSIATILDAGLFWQTLGFLVWLCPWSHFICDSIDCGVMWLWPLSEKQYALYHAQDELDAQHTPAPRSWRGLIVGYLKTPVAYVEIVLSLIGLTVAILYIWPSL